MKVVITGAGGFVGCALAQRLMADDTLQLVLVDTQLSQFEGLSDEKLSAGVRLVKGQLQDPAVRHEALKDGADVLFHLAAVPGGAAEANPELSKQVNLDATLALFEEAAEVGNKPRVVFTSTIAVLGAPLPEVVTDDCRIQPAMIYGTHKAMVELALADMSRRSVVDSVAVRLPGIVARPLAPSGLKSAFMSNLFHALKAGDGFISPVSSKATLWLMSVNQCVTNLMHAAQLDSGLMPASRVVTLPALRCTMGELSQAAAAQLKVSPGLVSYEPDADLEEHFGSHPALQTPAAERAGFAHDGSVAQLVCEAVAGLA
ncbi:NAD-dependent epimerase/dehydratase family protein [Aestuariicella hydrocarbonica]|uniref:NAD-dependent epimerase/dehydratase family protein n=1 Tax=Pseudomaricurvus hydrocarbonicus TaxID=1470433 RepID=A0A9E5JU49_9GAMM|nr:NAD-dependent epimerase/dehydratase family protein [Aestuariicella hydrocarbonica]NHO66873.1 NAD-dependent epimerase/dehydratase family protein [Aestuariicella hydrocarbonica]